MKKMEADTSEEPISPPLVTVIRHKLLLGLHSQPHMNLPNWTGAGSLSEKPMLADLAPRKFPKRVMALGTNKEGVADWRWVRVPAPDPANQRHPTECM